MEIFIFIIVVVAVLSSFGSTSNKPKSNSKSRNSQSSKKGPYDFVCLNCGHKVIQDYSKIAPTICPSCGEWGKFTGPF